jgi:hypothetical protein
METLSNNPVFFIICAALGIAVISVICYYIARCMKGSLKLELNQKSVGSGQQITGKLTATVKKHLIADRLYVGLIGEREERTRSSSSSGSSSTSKKWVEFYRDEVDVLLNEELPPGFEKKYDIVIDAPSEGHSMTGAQAISKTTENMEDGMAKSIVTGLGAIAGAAISMRGGRKRWKVISRLETKGVDLVTAKKIHVSLKSL